MTTGPDRILVQNRVDFVTGAVRRYVPDVDALTELSARVRELMAGQPVDRLLNEPAEGEWPAIRVLGHMITYARLLHDQLNRMAHMTDPVLPLPDDARAAEHELWETRKPEELVHLFVAAISESESLLKHLPDSSWGRAGVHPLLGRRSIVQQVRSGAAHLRGHLDQIEAALSEQ